MLTIKTNAVSTATLPTLRRDAMLDGDNGGVRFAFDLPFGFCWPGQDNPTNGDPVIDVAERANGAFVETGTGTAFAGGGFDYTSLTGGKGYVEGPSDALATISAGAQYFMVVSYMRLPSAADFAPSPGGVVASIFQAAALNYTTGPEMVMIDINPSYQIEYRRQKNGSTYQGMAPAALPDTVKGQLCQIAFWRNAAGLGLRVKSALGEYNYSTSVVDTNNVASFGALTPKWGAPPGYAFIPQSRLYGGWVEDLELSGRKPLTVLDAHWARTQARITASAAAHGGTSAIFV